ncbi:hypothetical protein ASPNIDRAFT_37026 [Aspergillus niger ATCC 1015]|uniref:Uncharacterized protein n=2 Tax=Aspergillus niger TaxID=5061 RepID=G3Y3F1_ASPNA|nr:hypothetical protein ASPNIDRAFT_37026 [Aspergillus niger ATCC 1015]RDH14214.1 hypothetical protein M747DRAFT_319720 [Aspergillus niger ATCC 13496]
MIQGQGELNRIQPDPVRRTRKGTPKKDPIKKELAGWREKVEAGEEHTGKPGRRKFRGCGIPSEVLGRWEPKPAPKLNGWWIGGFVDSPQQLGRCPGDQIRCG